ncbi:MAG: cytochrome c biogenesis protein ResB [Anaerolineae bacterium]|nr:cytochrome c biogenesis protein ResB [Anaerolineae bacterium]
MLIVLLLLAVALALSYTFPQIPAHVRSDPVTYEEWLSAIQVQYRGWTPVLRAIGAFDVRNAAWFQILTALVAFVSLVSLAQQLGAWIEQAQAVQPPGFFQTADAVGLSTPAPAERVVDSVQQALARLGLRAHTCRAETATGIAAGKHRWADASAPLTYAGVLALAIALAMNGRWGWRRTDVQLRPGEQAPIGPAGTHRIALVEVHPQGLSAEIEIDGGRRLHVVREHSTRWWGYEVQLRAAGAPLVEVTARRAQAEPLQLSEYAVRPAALDALEMAFSDAASEPEGGRLFIVPADKVVVRLQWINPRETGSGAPVRFRQWVFDQGGQSLIGEAEFEDEGGVVQTHIAGITYSWDIATYVVLDVAYQPGRWALGLGALLTAIGLLGRAVPRQRVWVRVAEDADGATVLIRQAVRGIARRKENALEKLVVTLQEEVGCA